MTTPPPTDGAGDWNRFWDVLLLLARAELPLRLRGKIGASDLVQQTLLEAHEKREQIRSDTDKALAAWLRTTLKRKVIDAVRVYSRQKRDVGREWSLEQAVEASSRCLEDWWARPAPGEDADRFEQMRRLARAMAELPEDQRAVMELRHCGGMKLKDIAREVDKTTGAVAGLLHRGLERLRARLQETDA